MNEEHQLALILAIITPIIAAVIAGISWGVKNFTQNRLSALLARKEDKLNDLRKIDELQRRIETMLQERIVDEATKRREADTSVRLMTEMTALLKTALAAKETP